ncbi:putative membrane protein [Anaplasma phagocytophilum str. CRT53-1]|uniref:Putative membrane protein n=1 Tax=Anaplasma phagocytophilum str. CRT53-1 TaxID=1359157 RepID=A0A0F3Q5L1_ANAPH|nr:putative membrane protein [Anaplasma phagocytophilum str. CRT53-1]
MVSVFQHLCCVSSIVLLPVAAYGFPFRYCCGVLCVRYCKVSADLGGLWFVVAYPSFLG